MGPVLLIFFALLVLVVLPIWVFVKISALSSEREVLWTRIRQLEADMSRLRQHVQDLDTPVSETTAVVPRESVASPAPPPVVTPPSPAMPPPLPAPVVPAPATMAPPPITIAAPPLPPAAARVSPSRLPTAAARNVSVNWEQFMGAKLFAWLGGLAGFLAVAYFVRYSFEHELIPPEVRVAIGFVLSAALIVAGLVMRAPRLRITSQVLCAMGIVSLYAVTFACNAVYHFAFFGTVPTFLLMTLVTATAFLLAVRMNAQVIAILGLLGGFLTPVLLSTGQDNPGGLFGFIALLDVGLIAVALHRSWLHLVPLAAGGTAIMQLGWASKFFAAPKAGIAVTICLVFCALFFSAIEMGRRWRRPSRHLVGSAAALCLVAFAFGFYFLSISSLAARPALLFGFLFVTDLLLLAVVWRNEPAKPFEALAGGLVFAFLAIWTGRSLTDALLPWGLGAYLVFAVLHTAFPLALQRLRPARISNRWSQIFPPMALLLMLGPLLKSDSVSVLFWPAVLMVDVVAVGLALVSASVAGLGIMLIFTLGAVALSIFRASGLSVETSSMLWVIAGFSLFFFAAGLFLARRLGAQLVQGRSGTRGAKFFGDTAAQIPAFSALLPFALLVMMSQRLEMANPSPLFGLALLLCVLIWGLSRLLAIEWLPICGLFGTIALEYAWHARLFDRDHATVPLAWYLGYYALFVLAPFVFRRRFVHLTGPWAVSALSGVLHFPLVFATIRQLWPNAAPGLLPAAFALAPLLSLVAFLRRENTDTPSRLNQLAWFGGTALFFITLVFPLQFDRQWITISWALEGVALLWLFHRVPHPGLRVTGTLLLIIAFVRLALNPAVLTYHPRSDTAVLNWYLYAYGVTLVCLFVAARLLAPPRERVGRIVVPPLLNGLGIVLAFLLLNIEIADYFTPAGSVLTFQFSGNFARDLAYTVGWALFALALLGIGIWKSARAARYAALALLSITLLKLFFHDLAQLGQLYRVAALVAVAAVAILASVLYQKFIPSDDRATPPES